MTTPTEILTRINALDDVEEEPRTYLGASSIGHKCSRWLWYQFHHACREKFSPRLKRLFARGQREEAVFVHYLRRAGMTVWETQPNGEQFGIIDFEGHFRGHMDGVGQFPGEEPVVLEFKTYNRKRFESLIKYGVKMADPKYYAQLQVYIQGMTFKRGLFCAVNKETDDLWMEYVEFDEQAFNLLHQKVWNILNNENPPPPISTNPEDFECRHCAARDICHYNQMADRNCRSCRFGEPAPDSAWICTKDRVFGTVCELWEDVTKPIPCP